MKQLKNIGNNLLSIIKEIPNRKEILINDKIAEKYINLIYEDWEKNKDIFRAKIADSGYFVTLWYKVSNYPNGHVNTLPGWGNRGDGELLIQINLIRTNILFDFDNDISRARISADIFFPYKGCFNLFGRDLETNKLIVNEKGIEYDVYDYINISKDKVEKLIKFIKNKYIEEYPELKGEKYFNEYIKHKKC